MNDKVEPKKSTEAELKAAAQKVRDTAAAKEAEKAEETKKSDAEAEALRVKEEEQAKADRAAAQKAKEDAVSKEMEARPTTIAATVVTEAERAEIEESPIADAVNKEITGPERIKEAGEVVANDGPVELTERQKAEVDKLATKADPERAALEKLAKQEGVNTDPDKAPTADGSNQSTKSLLKGASNNTPDQGEPETLTDKQLEDLLGSELAGNGDGESLTADAEVRARESADRLTKLTKSFQKTTPSDHVLFGYEGIKVTVGDLRNLFTPDTK